MISSAEEFVALRSSDNSAEYLRAAHEPAPEAVWLEVIERFPDYREWVAYNKSVPLSILELLSKDSDPRVRYTVARRRKAGETILRRLAHDPDPSIRVTVAGNPKAPIDLVREIASDPEEFVRGMAATFLTRRLAKDSTPPSS